MLENIKNQSWNISRRELPLKVLKYWEVALKYLPHLMFMELESMNFKLEKLSRKQLLNKDKKKKAIRQQ